MHVPLPLAGERAGHHCPFCDLVRGAAEVSMCYEDKLVMAFMDVQPVNPGHVLIVPKAHYEALRDIPRHVGRRMYEVLTLLIPVIQQVSGADDMNIVVNSGEAAGQSVFHYHIHLIPRSPEDGFDIPLPFPESQMPGRELLDAMAAHIGSLLREQQGV